MASVKLANKAGELKTYTDITTIKIPSITDEPAVFIETVGNKDLSLQGGSIDITDDTKKSITVQVAQTDVSKYKTASGSTTVSAKMNSSIVDSTSGNISLDYGDSTTLGKKYYKNNFTVSAPNPNVTATSAQILSGYSAVGKDTSGKRTLISGSYAIPTGTKTITAGTSAKTEDVTEYAKATINPTPSESKSTTTNGTIQPSSGKLLSSVIVNVPTGPAKSSDDITVDGAKVSVPAGLYSQAASKTIASGALSTPTIDSTTGVVTANVSTAGYLTTSATKTLSLPTQGAQSITPGTSNTTISSGKYLTGIQTIKGDANLKAENIANGVTIFGVTGTHSGGITPSGTITINTSGNTDVTNYALASVPAGTLGDISISDGSASVSVSKAGWLDTTTKTKTIPSGTFDDITIDTATGEITSKISQAGWLNATTKTKTLSTQAAATYTPTTTDKTLSAGTYLTGNYTIKGDANLKASNIKSGTKIFGTTGTYTGPTLSGTATTSQVLYGKTFYSNSTTKQTGSMTDYSGEEISDGTWTIAGSTDNDATITIPVSSAGYINGSYIVSNLRSCFADLATASDDKTDGKVVRTGPTQSHSTKTYYYTGRESGNWREVIIYGWQNKG